MRITCFDLLSCFVMCFGMTLNLCSQAPLSYSISLVNRNCDKKTITFKATIKNISTKDVIIDRKGPGYMLHVRKFGKPLTIKENRFSLTYDEFASIINDGHTPGYLRLAPKATFTDKRTLPLAIFDFLEKRRYYAIYFTYGQFATSVFEDIEVWQGTVESNTVKFRL